jgi:LuxR family maltose regulon positive regulatory protein
MTRGALGAYLRLADALPADVVRAHQRLGLSLAAAAGFTGQFDRVPGLLETVEATLTDDAVPPIGWRSARAAAMTLRAVFTRSETSATQMLETARAAVALEDDPGQQGWVISRMALGGVLSGMDRDDEAVQLLTEAVRRAPAVGLPPFTRHQAAACSRSRW